MQTCVRATKIPIDVAPLHIVSSLVSLQNFGGNLGGPFTPIITGILGLNFGRLPASGDRRLDGLSRPKFG